MKKQFLKETKDAWVKALKQNKPAYFMYATAATSKKPEPKKGLKKLFRRKGKDDGNVDTPPEAPLFLMSREEAFTKATLQRAGMVVDPQKAKLFWGRVTVEDERLCFNIAAKSKAKSANLLKKNMKKDAEVFAELLPQGGSFKQLAKQARYRMEVAELDDQAQIDTADEARKRGKASKWKTLGRSSYAKILRAVKDWHKAFGGASLDASNVAAAREKISAIETEIKAWTKKHKQEAEDLSTERAREVKLLQDEAFAARSQIDAFKNQVKEDDWVDDKLDELFGDGDSPKVVFQQDGATLARLQSNVAARLARVEDDDERSHLQATMIQLGKLAKVSAEAIEREVSGLDREKDPKAVKKKELELRQAQQTQLDGAFATLQRDGVSQEALDEIQRDSVTLLSWLEHTNNVEMNEVDAITTRVLRVSKLLYSLDQKELAIQLKDLVAQTAIAATKDELGRAAQTAQTTEEFNGSLARGNSVGSKTRAAIIKRDGKPFAKGVLGPAFKILAMSPFIKLEQPSSSELEAVRSTTATVKSAFTEAIDTYEQARLSRAQRVATRLGWAYRPSDIERVIDAMAPFDPTGEDPFPALPSVSEVVAEVYAAHPEPYNDVLYKALASVVGMMNASVHIVSLQTIAAEEMKAGRPLEMTALLLKLDSSVWRTGVAPESLADQLADGGFLEPDADQRDQFDETLVANAQESGEQARQKAVSALALLDAGGDELEPIKAAFKSAMDHLLADPSQIPKRIRVMCLGAVDLLDEIPNTDEQSKLKLLADMLVLRWLANLPFQLEAPAPDTGRRVASSSGKVLSALITSVANGVIPNDASRAPFIPLITKYIPKFREWLYQVIELTRDEMGTKRSRSPRDERKEQPVEPRLLAAAERWLAGITSMTETFKAVPNQASAFADLYAELQEKYEAAVIQARSVDRSDDQQLAAALRRWADVQTERADLDRKLENLESSVAEGTYGYYLKEWKRGPELPPEARERHEQRRTASVPQLELAAVAAQASIRRVKRFDPTPFHTRMGGISVDILVPLRARLEKEARELLQQMNQSLTEAREIETAAGKLFQGAERQLREAVASQTDIHAMLIALGVVGNCADAIDTRLGEIRKVRDQANEVYGQRETDWLAHEALFPRKLNPVQSDQDKADALRRSLEGLVDRVQRMLDQALKNAKNGEAFRKGQLDGESLILDTAERFSVRATKQAANLDGTVRDIGGALDKAWQDQKNAQESSDTQLVEALFRAALGALVNQEQRLNALEVQARHVQEEFSEERKGFEDFLDTLPFADIRDKLDVEAQYFKTTLETEIPDLRGKLSKIRQEIGEHFTG